jgi:chromosome segregation ATPase
MHAQDSHRLLGETAFLKGENASHTATAGVARAEMGRMVQELQTAHSSIQKLEQRMGGLSSASMELEATAHRLQEAQQQLVDGEAVRQRLKGELESAKQRVGELEVT